MDELAALRYQRLLREGKLASSQDGKVPVYLQLQDETGFHHEGTIDFSDNSVDSSTGTLLIRASLYFNQIDETLASWKRRRISRPAMNLRLTIPPTVI